MRIAYSLWLVIASLTACHTESTVDSKHKQATTEKLFLPGRAVVQSDGAPDKPVALVFKEPVPMQESMSRYGNPQSYQVDGKVYEVLRSAKGYKARGIASWYGTKFHEKRTSSGEDYDMYAMTAAHKTLPLPTYVKVKNLENGQEAIVKVNDRGPFHADRILDLSYAAASKLGFLPKGTAKVEIEVLLGQEQKAHYYLQAAAFRSEHFAEALRDKLAKLTHFPVFVEQHDQHYLVKAGPFAEESMTKQLQANLQSQGVQGSFVILQ